MALVKKFYSIFYGKCPKCHKKDLFKHKNPYNLHKAFEMVEACSHCGQKTEPEPGFYYGAMYVSYALAVALACFVGVPMLFFGAEPIPTIIAISAALLFFSPLTLRYSRMIWINLFYHYDESHETEANPELNNHKSESLT